ncbi:hypothetical protein BPOR_0144g00110 [Botrytis porri]|uniref:Uncharacterized protein n=1 Tax=Botrytis porri TaxID=87229 RepID=A0A4Z1KW59_9HELO|nr:hypothetical protein BPOR_0144g00110 [Botrytis porri]
MFYRQINITVTPGLPLVLNGLAVIGLGRVVNSVKMVRYWYEATLFTWVIGGLHGTRDFANVRKAFLEAIGKRGQAEVS